MQYQVWITAVRTVPIYLFIFVFIYYSTATFLLSNSIYFHGEDLTDNFDWYSNFAQKL